MAYVGENTGWRQTCIPKSGGDRVNPRGTWSQAIGLCCANRETFDDSRIAAVVMGIEESRMLEADLRIVVMIYQSHAVFELSMALRNVLLIHALVFGRGGSLYLRTCCIVSAAITKTCSLSPKPRLPKP
jgi:hypothetical protein